MIYILFFVLIAIQFVDAFPGIPGSYVSIGGYSQWHNYGSGYGGFKYTYTGQNHLLYSQYVPDTQIQEKN